MCLNKNYVIMGLCAFAMLILFLMVFVVKPMREAKFEKSRLNKARAEVRIQERAETEMRIRNEAVENGVAEFYIDDKNEKKFRWLKSKGAK